MNIARLVGACKRLEWSLPTRRDIIIYDSYSERHLRPFFLSGSYQVFDTGLQRINLWVLLRSLRFGRPNLVHYFLAYVQTTHARLVISTIDNSPTLYQIKPVLPNVHVVVIQNGRRDTIAKFPNESFVNELSKLNLNRKCQVDYFFTFGMTEVEQFRELIECTFVPHGSLKNNFLKRKPDPKNRTLTFVSSLPRNCSLIETDSNAIMGYSKFEPILLRTYFEAEFLTAEWLQRFAIANNLGFQILGKRSHEFEEQEILFRRRVTGDWKFIYCNYEYESYETLLNSDYIAGVDSTLLYEMFGRGKRTAFFTIRRAILGLETLHCPNFGFPAIKEDCGPMWTNIPTATNYLNVAKTVTMTSDAEWSKIVDTYAPLVMNWDFGNGLLAETLSSLDFPVERDESSRIQRAVSTYLKAAD